MVFAGFQGNVSMKKSVRDSHNKVWKLLLLLLFSQQGQASI